MDGLAAIRRSAGSQTYQAHCRPTGWRTSLGGAGPAREPSWCGCSVRGGRICWLDRQRVVDGLAVVQRSACSQPEGRLRPCLRDVDWACRTSRLAALGGSSRRIMGGYLARLARRPSRLPATPPGPPPHPACLPSLTALPASSATTVFRALQCASASSSSCKGCRCGVHVNVQTPPIFYTPHLMFYVPPLKFYVLPQKFYVPHLIFYVPPPIFYVNLACDAVDTQLALPLPPSVVN